MKYDEIKVGMKVDYHSDITGPITIDNCTVESDPWQIGHGEWVVLISEIYGGVPLNALTICTEKSMNKEEIYINMIQPLMINVFKICKENKIDMVAEFFLPTNEKPSQCCSTVVIEDVTKIPDHMCDLVYRQQIQYMLAQQAD